MLIDDRQLKSIHVNKVIDIATVGKTNSYSDLDGIPESFPPTEHTHELATSTKAGYMSSDQYNTLYKLNNFKTIKVISADNKETSITATVLDDTLILSAGKHVVFKYDEESKNLIIDVDYSEELANIKGDKGDPGEDGKNGITWRPYLNEAQELAFTVDLTNSEEPPSAISVIGAVGPSGKNAEPTTWENLDGKPHGNTGDVVYINNDLDNNIESDQIVHTGIFFKDDEEYTSNQDTGLIDEKYWNYIASNFIPYYYLASNNNPESISNYNIFYPQIIYNMDSAGNQESFYPCINFDTGTTINKKLYCYLDTNYHSNFDSIEVLFTLDINSTSNGAVGIILGDTTNNTFTSGENLSFMVGINRDSADFIPTDVDYMNLVVMSNYCFLEPKCIAKTSFESLQLYKNNSNIDKVVSFKMKISRSNNDITCAISNIIDHGNVIASTVNIGNLNTVWNSNQYTYDDSNKIIFNMKDDSRTRTFVDSSKIGICCQNIKGTAYLYLSDYEYFNVYCLSGTNKGHYIYNPILSTLIKESSDLSGIGIGRFLKDSKTEQVYYIKALDDIIVFNDEKTSGFDIVNNYIIDSSIDTSTEKVN